VGIENCFISEITIAELLFDAENSTNCKKHIQEVMRGLLCFFAAYGG
jgi:hypothetical protein